MADTTVLVPAPERDALDLALFRPIIRDLTDQLTTGILIGTPLGIALGLITTFFYDAFAIPVDPTVGPLKGIVLIACFWVLPAVTLLKVARPMCLEVPNNPDLETGSEMEAGIRQLREAVFWGMGVAITTVSVAACLHNLNMGNVRMLANTVAMYVFIYPAWLLSFAGMIYYARHARNDDGRAICKAIYERRAVPLLIASGVAVTAFIVIQIALSMA